MEGIIVTKFERHPDGYWTARVHNGDATMYVQHKFGSWMTEPDTEGRMRDVLAPLNGELTARMRRAEKREKNGGEPDPQDIDPPETNPFIRKAKAKEAVSA